MTSLRKTHTTDAHGGHEGSNFDDKTVIRDINTAAISRIVVSYDSFLRSITVHYADIAGVTHGNVGGSVTEVTLLPGEFITKVEGTCITYGISRIGFVTNTGKKWGPYGATARGNEFVLDGIEPGMGLLYLSGKADGYIRNLKATFGMYNDQPNQPPGVRYEKHVIAEAATQPFNPRSYFTTVLVSPTVKLVVGTDKQILNVSQHILCRLPFFRAALQGSFREAAEQTVSMPEDELQDITALVEFLYTDRYTYPYNVAVESGPNRPAPDLTEGLYHVGVYATAHKYGCLELVATALDLFMYVLGHLKGIEVVHLWKGAYAMNLQLQQVEHNEKMEEFIRGLAGLLTELYTDHRSEMETTAAEYPLLLNDLLRLVVT